MSKTNRDTVLNNYHRSKIYEFLNLPAEANTEIEASFGLYDYNSRWFVPGLSHDHTNNLHEFLNSDPNIDKISQIWETVYIITSGDKSRDLRHIEVRDPIDQHIISTYTQRKNASKSTSNKLDLMDYGIRIKSANEYVVSDSNFRELWDQIVVTTYNKKSRKMGLRRSKFRTSYTSTDLSSVYYGLSIDITHVIETEYYDDGHHVYTCRYEIELEITKLDYYKDKNNKDKFIRALEDLYQVINYVKPQPSVVLPKAGIYFGSFDPIHANHFLLAQSTMQNQHLDYLFWVPNTQNALKGKLYANIHYRINMIALKVGQSNIITMSSADKTKLIQESMYVINPEKINTDKNGRASIINFIEAMYGIQITCQIVGSDSIRDTIERTKDTGYGLIRRNKCKFVVYPRANDPPLKIPTEIKNKIIVDNQHNEDAISSTFIRKNIHNEHAQIKDNILDPVVKQYILDNGLYNFY